jgi:hypothetical protein
MISSNLGGRQAFRLIGRDGGSIQNSVMYDGGGRSVERLLTGSHFVEDRAEAE